MRTMLRTTTLSNGGAKVEVLIEVAVPNLVTDNSKKISIFVAIFKTTKI